MVYCVFSLESPHRGDSNEYTQYTILSSYIIKMKITLNYPKSVAMGFYSNGLEGVWNSQRKRAINVRAIEVLQYLLIFIVWTLFVIRMKPIWLIKNEENK